MREMRICFVAIVLLMAVNCRAKDSVAKKSSKPDPGPVPGVVINYSPSKTKDYLGAPSIAILDDGHYVASHNIWGTGPKASKGRFTSIFESLDSGKSWRQLTEMDGQWWSSLFVHKDQLYIFGTSKGHGNIVIRRSEDGGKTWTKPDDKNTGLLVEGKFHCAPVPVVVHKGRIWRGFELNDAGDNWGAFVMSCAVDADLLAADNWIVSRKLRVDEKIVGHKWIEGNVVVTPEGGLVNILRTQPKADKAAIIEISPDGRSLGFNLEDGLIDFPGANKKFTIRYDKITNKYWSLVNIITDPGPMEQPPQKHRNTLALTCSTDLRQWDVRYIALSFMRGGHLTEENNKFGFQYIDWRFEGNDIVFVSRTAWGWETPRYHDANYITFHRIAKFRDKTLNNEPLFQGP
ncbi:MAG: sialidase family protein [Planctomycetota bacterium]